jgi:hypothetical protein
MFLHDVHLVSRTHSFCVDFLICVAYTHKLLHQHLIQIQTLSLMFVSSPELNQSY